MDGIPGHDGAWPSKVEPDLHRRLFAISSMLHLVIPRLDRGNQFPSKRLLLLKETEDLRAGDTCILPTHWV